MIKNFLPSMPAATVASAATVLPPAFAFIIIIALSLLFEACWTLKQGVTLISYLHSAVPLETLAQGGKEDAEFVGVINDIRAFASDELGLSGTKNYTKYVELNRDYLAAVVSASAKDSFKRHEWWFPIVGSVPYKGFFNSEDAKKELEKLRKKDLDVLMRPVDAFSTLGWFNDPLYSFMKDYSEERLADLIIHESFHATLFLKGRTQFNEELAEFVGTEGARLYIEKKHGKNSKDADILYKNESGNKQFISCLKSLITELEELYKRDIERQEKLAQKEIIISEWQKRFAKEYDFNFKTDRYKFISTAKINNAYLELYRLYHESGERLKKIYEDSGAGLPLFISAAKTLNNKSDPYSQLQNALQISFAEGAKK